MNINARVLYISHGGGPLPLIGDDAHREMVAVLRQIAAAMPKPSAIVVVSAHWEERVPAITAAARPPLIYDYYGFPEETYSIEYACPGEPLLAGKIGREMESAGIAARIDERRGLDHGVFVPMKIMYPDADIPCVQLSLVDSLDPQEHINIGRAIGGLDYENLLVIGSGFSFHNMKAFFAAETDVSKAMNESFQSWLIETCSSTDIDENERERRLVEWEKAPSARFCHPREEHLLPLHVCYGIAGARCSKHYELRILNKYSTMFLWE